MILCLISQTEGCPIPLDFAMIVDGSGSISRRNFIKLKDFMQDLLDGFDISEEGTHIAVIEYSTQASLKIKFNDFSGARLNAANIKRKILGIKREKGYTYIDKALRLANNDVFSEKSGMRPNVTKVSSTEYCKRRYLTPQIPIDGLHVTSRRPCWWTGTIRFFSSGSYLSFLRKPLWTNVVLFCPPTWRRCKPPIVTYI